MSLASFAVALLTGCGESSVGAPPTTVVESPTTVSPASTTTTTSTTTSTTSSTTTTSPPPLVHVFPFVGRSVSYGSDHHDYPAVDVFGCGATVVAPVSGTVLETRTVDLWPGSGNNPAYRGGLYVSLGGDDAVRYYFAHLESVAVQPGQRVSAGDALGVMGQTGNAARSACHTHVGFSWTCGGTEWQVRRGEVWPQMFLDAWRAGENVSPADAVAATRDAQPDACAEALADPDAPLA